jgi:hypothetical protein
VGNALPDRGASSLTDFREPLMYKVIALTCNSQKGVPWRLGSCTTAE